MGHVHIRTLMDGIGTYTWVLEGTMYVSLGEHKLATTPQTKFIMEHDQQCKITVSGIE